MFNLTKETKNLLIGLIREELKIDEQRNLYQKYVNNSLQEVEIYAKRMDQAFPCGKANGRRDLDCRDQYDRKRRDDRGLQRRFHRWTIRCPHR